MSKTRRLDPKILNSNLAQFWPALTLALPHLDRVAPLLRKAAKKSRRKVLSYSYNRYYLCHAHAKVYSNLHSEAAAVRPPCTTQQFDPQQTKL